MEKTVLWETLLEASSKSELSSEEGENGGEKLL